jgi:primary-amine oxidase
MPVKLHSAKTFLIYVTINLLITSCAKDQPATTPIARSINQEFAHPLNPLDTTEINLVKDILLKEGKIDTTYLFFLINLKEPAKATMKSYVTGQDFGREAFASVYDRASNKTFEAIIDLRSGKVLSFEHIPGVTPGMLLGDSIADTYLKQDKQWMEGLALRGIHPDSVKSVNYVYAGEMGIAPAHHRELICVPVYKNKKLEHFPIDGLVAYVDMTEGKVLKVLDDGGKGFFKPQDIGYFNSDSAYVYLPTTKPLKITQPEGTTYSVEGYHVNSPLWSFRIGIHNREGLVLYQVNYNDRGEKRSIVYRASMAEMYVPYGSTDLGLASWNYFDGGAYRMGQSITKAIHKLKAGADVPENATFIPATFHNESGKPVLMDSMIAVYEEFGGPITRHGKFSHEARNLVVKYYTKIGNYDYGFKWIFREEGTIDLKVELTGIVGIKAVNRTNDLPGVQDDSYKGIYYGTLVAPHVEAVNHQHFFSFRLDMDVDGAENLVEEMNTVAVPPGKGNPWNNAFVNQMSLIKNESEGQRNLNPNSNRHWMVADSKSVNTLGQLKSYVLMPGHNALLFAAPGSAARRMADFLENQVWVTAYNENEFFPAGNYPNSRNINDGLPAWNNKEDLQGKDIVLWYNMGITHIVRPEDWPVMNVHQIGFSLAPFGFFDRNPVAGMVKEPTRERLQTLIPPDVTLCVPLPKQ